MANIVLKDINGNEATYSRDKIMVDTAEGGTQIFSEGEAVENVPITLYLSDGDQTVTAPDGMLVKSAIILKPENLKPENIAKDVDIAGVVGEFEGGIGEEVTVALNMANGNQVIVPTDDRKTLSKVTVTKPGTLIPENIKKGVSIGGVSGEYALDNMPQLYAPTGISFTNGNTGYLTVTNPTAKNGFFPSRVQILVKPSDQADYVVAAEAAMSTESAVSSVTIKGAAFNRSIALAQPIARFCADGFQDSELFTAPNVLYIVFGLLYDLVGLSLNKTDKFAFSSDTITYQLTAQDSYYLPKAVEVTADNYGTAVEPEYTYDPDAGTLILVGRAADTMTIKAHAVQIPWLRNPVLPIDNTLMLTVEKIDENATETKVFVDGEHALSVADEREGMLSWALEHIKAYEARQAFTLQSSGYYRATCASSGSYSVARVDFDMITEAEVEICGTRYLGSSIASYLQTTFGMVSNVDTVLASGTADDGTSKVAYYWGKNLTSQTYSSTTKITIPAGKHFLYFKYRQPNTASSGYFEFKINTPCAENTKYTITEFFPTYGEYNVQAQSYADGYTESDLVTLGYSYKPVIEVENDILTIANPVPSNVTAFEVYIDGELKDTPAYDSTAGLSVDLSTYALSSDDVHTVYVVGVGDGVPANQSNEILIMPDPYYSVGAVSGASYGFTLDSSTGYYVSGNKGVNSSAAVCKVTFNTQGKHLYLDCINYAEANYDFGILSNIDSTLTTTNTEDTTRFKSFKGSSSASVQTVDYGVVAAGEHFIYVKFRKDGSGNANNDTLQFKVRFE